MASICALCWTNDSLSVPLEYDYNALHMVCVNCGVLADGELQTLGRALEGEDSHHTGRSRVESRPGLATKVEAKIGRFRSAGQVYNPSDRARKEEAKIRSEIDRYCRSIHQVRLSDRAKNIFSTTLAQEQFRFGRHALRWLVASIILAAEDASRPIDIKAIMEHYRVSLRAVRKSKVLARQAVVNLNLPVAQALSISVDVLHSIVDLLEGLLEPTQPDDSSDEEEADEIQVQLHPKNGSFLRGALRKRERIVELAGILASHFQNNKPMLAEGSFALACMLFCCEAIELKTIPLLKNLAAVLAPYSRSLSARSGSGGASPGTICDRYRTLVNWAARVFVSLPWIPQTDKEDVEQEDRSGDEESATISQAVAHKTGGRGKKVGKAKARAMDRRVELVRYYEEVIRYRALPSVNDEATTHLAQFPPVRKPKAEAIARAGLIDLADGAIKGFLEPATGDAPANMHTANAQHFLRLLLNGERAEELKSSLSIAHAPVEPCAPGSLAQSTDAAALFRGRIAQIIASRGSVDAIQDDELFMPGELDGFLRSPSEVEEQERLAMVQGLYDDYDNRTRKSEMLAERKAQAAAKKQRDFEEGGSTGGKRKGCGSPKGKRGGGKRRRRHSSTSGDSDVDEDGPILDLDGIDGLIDPTLLFSSGFHAMRNYIKEGEPVPQSE